MRLFPIESNFIWLGKTPSAYRHQSQGVRQHDQAAGYQKLRQENIMKDAYEVLRQKETDFARLRREIDALRVAIPLLLDPVDDVPNDRDGSEVTDTARGSDIENMRRVNTN